MNILIGFILNRGQIFPRLKFRISHFLIFRVKQSQGGIEEKNSYRVKKSYTIVATQLSRKI